MEQNQTPKNKGGRPFIPEDQRMVSGGIRLTREQWAQFKELGGVDWLRDAIKRAHARRK